MLIPDSSVGKVSAIEAHRLDKASILSRRTAGGYYYFKPFSRLLLLTGPAYILSTVNDSNGRTSRMIKRQPEAVS